jgi:hypothetical protein
MSRTVLAALTLTAVAAASLARPAVGYLLTLTPADGTTPITAQAPLDATSISCSVPAGTYTGSVAVVDDNGTPLAPAVSDPNPLVVTDTSVVNVNVPAALALSVA